MPTTPTAGAGAGGSVGSLIECGSIQSLGSISHFFRGGDFRGGFRIQVSDEFGRGPADDPHLRVLLQPGPRVGNIQVAHRELPDPVIRVECSLRDPLHREALRLIAECGALRIDDAVVVSAAQPEGDTPGYR